MTSPATRQDVVLHVRGFGPYPHAPERIVSDVKASIHHGSLADIANAVLDAIEAHGHTVRRSSVRSLDGWLREAHAVVDVDGTAMWHLFVKPSEQWPTKETP